MHGVGMHNEIPKQACGRTDKTHPLSDRVAGTFIQSRQTADPAIPSPHITLYING